MPDARVSPFAPAAFPALAPIAGVRVATAAVGVHYRGRTDVMMAALDPGTSVAGVFTTSRTSAAPVAWCRRILGGGGGARGLVVNAGNANVFTGRDGAVAVGATAEAGAHALGCAPHEVFVASTGVIGVKLPYERVTGALPDMARDLAPGRWREAAEAIRTTDTYAKGAGAVADIAGVPVVISGICKGSGMIAPDMATMHAYLFTDARLPAAVLQPLLATANATSFNCITVDSDTSTSDTVLLFSTGRGPEHVPIAAHTDRRLADFKAKLGAVMTDLAHQIVRDGEGASKFIAIHVGGAASRRAARKIGLSIANSPLVKTAIGGSDPNWGRIIAAIGKAGENADRDRIRICFGDTVVATDGGPADHDEPALIAYMRGTEVAIAIDVGVGRGRATVWTCDLTKGYIDINTDYRS
jgi:glutamate N-acetyltransferase/amino-acid N-acetyltransferase